MPEIGPQVETIRKKAGIFRSSPRALLSVTGPDRARFLHNLLTHDIKGLALGQGRPACLLDRQGKIRFFAWVHASPERIILEMEKSAAPVALQALTQYLISERAEIQDLTAGLSPLAVYGPQADELIEKITGVAETGIAFLYPCNLLRVPGHHLWINVEAAQAAFEKLLELGSSLGAEEISQEAFHAFRIESGIPWPGVEMDETVILNELWNYEELTSFTKGCYVGQEIVSRIKYRAHPPRQLTGFLLEGSSIPPLRSPILAGGKSVGIITSACFSPTLQRAIALGFLTYGLSEKEFAIQTKEGGIPAEVTQLPFV